MAGYSPEHAMREFLRRGSNDQAGLDELRAGSPSGGARSSSATTSTARCSEVRELLDQAVLAERGQLARDITMDDERPGLPRDDARQPARPSTAAAVSELSSYDWQSSEAREAYEQIKDLLGRELLDQRFAGMKQALEGATDEDRAAVAEMLSDLNDLLEKHAAGGDDTDEEFADFMDKHGDFFPENPQDMDELLDSLAQRAAAAQRMLNSMTAGAAPGADGALAAGLRLAAADGAAGPDGRQPPGAAARRGLVGLGELRGRPGDGARRRHRRAPGPRPARRAGRPARPVATSGARLDDVDLDALARPARHRRPRSRRRPCRSSSRRCATAATSSAAPTASCGSRPRRCASSARRCCATWPTG